MEANARTTVVLATSAWAPAPAKTSRATFLRGGREYTDTSIPASHGNSYSDTHGYANAITSLPARAVIVVIVIVVVADVVIVGCGCVCSISVPFVAIGVNRDLEGSSGIGSICINKS